MTTDTFTWQVPFANPDLGSEEAAAAANVIRSGWLTMGEVTERFEREFAQRLYVRHAFAVANCTAALHLAYLALGIGEGDEVIVPSLTFVATANAAAYTGARVVFADIRSDEDLTLDVEDVERRITPKTRAIGVMHYGGWASDMSRLRQLASDRGLRIVEDCAHSPLVATGSGMLGTLGDVGCFSFFGNKNITTGEGGMVVTNQEPLAERIRLLRSHGMTTLTYDRFKGHQSRYDVVGLGYNYRIDDIRSAIGLVQLDKLLPARGARRSILSRYADALAGRLLVPFAARIGREDAAYHLAPVVAGSEQQRDALMAHLRSRGIQTSVHYPPAHLFDYYRRRPGGEALPVTERVAASLVTLPLFAAMSSRQVDLVIQGVLDFLG